MVQTERDWRLIVLNHASTDATGEIIDRLGGGSSRTASRLWSCHDAVGCPQCRVRSERRTVRPAPRCRRFVGP
ncbi:hypothetical protein [Sphingomonas sp. LR59]|uniref:hypothetical protein n=1 Tax=Sphingomonas sp. LR59 TaxID=3050232 RepID=UPI003FA74308